MNQSTMIESPRAGSLVSIQVGKVNKYGDAAAKRPDEKEWTSAILKHKIGSLVYCTKLGLEGDEQADRKHHGGPDKALLAYPYEHYDKWNEELSAHDWAPGGFGENLTITQFDESTVYIGDVFQIGGVVVQVSEPRQPCYKLARKWGIKELPNLVMQNNRSGWYFRVMQPGEIYQGAEVKLIDRSNEEWSAAHVSYIIRHVGDDFDRAERLYECEQLSGSLRAFFRKAIDQHDPRKQTNWKTKLFSIFNKNS